MSRSKQLVLVGALAVGGCAAWERAAAQQQTPTPRAAAPRGPAAGSIVVEADIPPDLQKDSWARLPRLKREEMDAKGQRAWDMVVNPNSRYAGGSTGPVTMWLYSPKMIEHIFPASTYLRFETGKDQRLTELAILATAREV